MAQETYEAIIVGAGQAGSPLASAYAAAGKRVALIEREAVGGTCVNRGCTPTKTMIASARVAYLARRGQDYGVHTGDVRVDLAKVRERQRSVVESFRRSSETSLKETEEITLLYGEASLSGPKTVEVRLRDGGTKTLTAAGPIFLNTGARPTLPKIDGLDTVPFLDSTSIMELDAVPEHLMILGGGYIALEFGQMFRRFGSRVTIVERAEYLMEHEDPDICAAMTEILTEDGLEILTGTQATKAASDNNKITLTLTTREGSTKTITGTHLLVAVGRTPNTEKLGLDAVGVKTDERGHILTNPHLETNVPGIYALGDVKGGPAFTHISYDDYRIVAANLLHGGGRSTADRPVPYTVFTDPQLGRVGLTETEAKKSGKAIKVATLPMSHVARAIETDETRGLMKAVVDADTGQILGAAILGVDGGEVMSVLEVAMLGKLPYTVLRDATLAHPTLAESLNNLFMGMK